jgi:hypothetical protein
MVSKTGTVILNVKSVIIENCERQSCNRRFEQVVVLDLDRFEIARAGRIPTTPRDSAPLQLPTKLSTGLGISDSTSSIAQTRA